MDEGPLTAGSGPARPARIGPRYVPLLRRPDGERIGRLGPLRKVMPLLFRNRHEAEVYHPVTYDLSRTLPWLEQLNANGEHPRATVFHLFLWASAQMMHRFPHLNRFAAGNHLYQRHEVSLAFSVKVARDEDSPFVLTKLIVEPDESFVGLLDRVAEAAEKCRTTTSGVADLELVLVDKLPAVLTAAGIRLLRLADRLCLLPPAMIDDDAMFSSMLLGNLGSVGLDAPYHHLNDYGSASVFATLGLVRQAALVVDGAVVPRDVVTVRYTLDERVADGFYSARAIEFVRGVMEDPTRL